MRHAKFKNVFCRFRSFEIIPGYIFECTSLQKLPLMPPLFDSFLNHILLPSFAVSRRNKEAGSSLFPSLNDNEEEIQNMAVACDRFFLFPFFSLGKETDKFIQASKYASNFAFRFDNSMIVPYETHHMFVAYI